MCGDGGADAAQRARIRADDPMKAMLGMDGDDGGGGGAGAPATKRERKRQEQAPALWRPHCGCLGKSATSPTRSCGGGGRIKAGAKAGWDGKDRSNGFEARVFAAAAGRTQQQERQEAWTGVD
eukprot:gene25427-19793_t